MNDWKKVLGFGKKRRKDSFLASSFCVVMKVNYQKNSKFLAASCFLRNKNWRRWPENLFQKIIFYNATSVAWTDNNYQSYQSFQSLFEHGIHRINESFSFLSCSDKKIFCVRIYWLKIGKIGNYCQLKSSLLLTITNRWILIIFIFWVKFSGHRR